MKVFILFACAITLALPFGVAAQSAFIKIDGSSTVFPITEAAAYAFQQEGGVETRVTVGFSGTTGGFRKFCRGEIDVADASRPIARSEMAACAKNGIRYLEMPIAFDALTVVVNPQASLDAITIEELRVMWGPPAEGQITRWNHVNGSFPKAPLRLFGAGPDSGTFDYFTEAVVGKAGASRRDFTASEDDEVLVAGIGRDVHALGYFGYAYYAEHKDRLKALAIGWKGRKPILPSVEAVVNGRYQPLSRPVFIYVNAASAQRPEVKAFVIFYNAQAERLVQEMKYVPLPAKAYAHNLETLDGMRIGTRFGGENRIGLTIDELMRIEAKP